jgi:hypothetical protein
MVNGRLCPRTGLRTGGERTPRFACGEPTAWIPGALPLTS